MKRTKRIVNTITKAYIKGPFTKVHLAAIIIGGFLGGMLGTLMMSGDQGEQSWPIVIVGFAIGAVLGIGFALSVLPDPKHTK